MSTIIPQNELHRRALTWISEARKAGDDRPMRQLVDEAAMRFNLGPLDVEFLNRFLKESGEPV